MSGSRAERLIESGLWLRLSGDLTWSQQLFEEAFRLDPGSAVLEKLRRPSNGSGGIRFLEELWSLLPITISPRPNPFKLPDGSAPAVDATENWNHNTVWRLPPEAEEPPLPDIDVEPIEFEELEPLVEFDPVPQVALRRKTTDHAAGPEDLDQLLRAAEEFIELEDPEAAMDLIVKAEAISRDHPKLKKVRERGEEGLQSLYESKVGPLEAVPRVIIPPEKIVSFHLDHRAGFVLSQIDGALSFEDLFSLSGMSRLDTIRILAQLLELNVISRA
jgi:hypothetical protein